MPDDTTNQDQNKSSDEPAVQPQVFHPDTETDKPTEQPIKPGEDSEVPSVENPTEPNRDELAIPAAAGDKPVQKKSKKSLFIFALVLLIAVAGAAWWLTQKSDTKNSSSSNKTSETQEIELLRIGTAEGPANNIFPNDSVNGVQIVIDRQVYEGLVGLEESKIVPQLAQSWTNPDDRTWVFKLRPNTKFHTGKTVTAKEVKAALENLNTYDFWSLFTSTIDTVEATGDLEVTIKTKEPDALLLNRLSSAFISDLEASDNKGNNGTGAYRIDTSATNNENTVTLVAFDEHHAGRPKTRKLTYTIFKSDDEIVKALKDKTIDIAETLPIPSVKSELEGLGFANTEFNAPGVFGLYMNHKRSATTIIKNKDFRHAVALAMDRQDLIDKVGNKNTPSFQVIPKSLPGHDESNSFPKFDLTAAKAALAKSGYKNQPLDYIYIKEVQQDAPIIIEQLRLLGLNIREKAYTGDTIDQALDETGKGNFDFFSASFTSDISDARDLLGALLSSKESSYPIYDDPEYDKLLADSDQVFDPTERIVLLQKANQYITDNLIWIPLRSGTYVTYYPKDIDVHIEFNGGGSIGAYFRKVGRIVQ